MLFFFLDPFRGKADFVYQSGDIDRVATDATANSDVSAFVLWLQGGVMLGAANLSVNYVMSSGDTNQNDRNEHQFFAVGVLADFRGERVRRAFPGSDGPVVRR
jgi:hypothetical protein